MAQAAGETGWHLDILLDDCGSHDAALAYLQGLTREEAGAALKKHGKVPGRHGLRPRTPDTCIAALLIFPVVHAPAPMAHKIIRSQCRR